ncbi:MAG: hypothetical protein IPM29_05705 [Planctomycetes bacterium]|nr:hypothetical protein [Planctomycetota bacterium]
MPAARLLSLSAAASVVGLGFVAFLPTPTDVQQPGTQPNEAGTLPGNCLNCHAGYDPQAEPGHQVIGSPMTQAGKDPLFWATVAVAEQDFAGVGDLCLRCHAPRGWLEGRSTPSDGSGLAAGDDGGVECMLCHALVNPDGSEHAGIQFAPYLAHSATTPPEGFHGSGMYVIRAAGGMMGPYAQTVARHTTTQSAFHRDSRMCATCHDVSNPVVGDLAPGNGAMLPLPPGTFSGTLGAPVTQKVAFNLPPFRYGMVERTSSEHASSAFAALPIAGFASLPEELQDGSIAWAYEAAMASNAGGGGSYLDGTPRTFSCQSCHMRPITGRGADKSNVPLRADLPQHDLMGGNAWLADALVHLDSQGRLPLGSTLSAAEIVALRDGADRARAHLARAVSLRRHGDALRVYNLTGHKFSTGFPEGRRAWLHVTWYGAGEVVLREDGAYGPLQVTIGGRAATVDSLLDLHDPHARIWEAKPGISKEWATTLVQAGVPGTKPLTFDRLSGAVTQTLAQLAASPAGTVLPTFHFALNDRFASDTRIPPYGFRRDEAERRAALPVPADQYGAPGPGGVYRHWDELALTPPTGARWAEVEVLYQTTSWEYVQFLVEANDGSVAHLAQADDDLLDAWLQTGMSAPVTVATTTWCRERGTGDDLVLHTIVDEEGDPTGCRKSISAGQDLTIAFRSPNGSLDGSIAAVVIEIVPSGAPSPVGGLPGIWFDRSDLQLATPSLPAAGVSARVTLGAGLEGYTLRMQAVALSNAAANGLYAASDAHDVEIE